MGSCISKNNTVRRSGTHGLARPLGYASVAGKCLYIIVPYSNPCAFRRRQVLLRETVQKLIKTSKECPNLQIVVSSMLYQKYPAQTINVGSDYVDIVSSGPDVLWAKENLINIAIRWILANTNADYIGWIDADVDFVSSTWVQDTLSVFSKHPAGAFIQLFSKAIMLDAHGRPEHNVSGFCNMYKLGRQLPQYNETRTTNQWHPGYAWAADRATLAYLQRELGYALIQYTLGGADRHMATSIICMEDTHLPAEIDPVYRDMLSNWGHLVRSRAVRLDVVLGTIQHHYHGALCNRQYRERWAYLREFVPSMMEENEYGVLQWSRTAPAMLKFNVIKYLRDRDEDDIYRILQDTIYKDSDSWATSVMKSLSGAVGRSLYEQNGFTPPSSLDATPPSYAIRPTPIRLSVIHETSPP